VSAVTGNWLTARKRWLPLYLEPSLFSGIKTPESGFNLTVQYINLKKKIQPWWRIDPGSLGRVSSSINCREEMNGKLSQILH
jgi:hypothetical protein